MLCDFNIWFLTFIILLLSTGPVKIPRFGSSAIPWSGGSYHGSSRGDPVRLTGRTSKNSLDDRTVHRALKSSS